jgi:eukaryotic-like serine/threonine-protein kinase
MGETSPPIQPSRFGRYEIEKELGRGTMGVVYEARDTILGRPVALKTISLAFTAAAGADRVSFERRFIEEARAAGALSHPNIVIVYDVGTEPETQNLFMALEYLRGRTLEWVLAQGPPMPWTDAVNIVTRLADALRHAHTQGVVHRDIKPANIMILESGEPKLMDFGVAKLDASQLTAGGQILGSPSYMSPEQAAGERVDSRSDVFALGAVLYEMLTGRKAFAGPNLPAILMKLAHEDPPPPSSIVPGLPEALDAIVSRALAKSPNDRYAGGRSLREDLEDVIGGRTARHTLPPPKAPAKKKSKNGEDTAKSGGSSPSLGLPPAKRVSLAILEGPRRGEMIRLERPRVLIGRAGGGAQADVELSDPEVSRAHALVECYGTRIVLRDLDSRNGTFVEADRIAERTIDDHTEFRVGRTRFLLILTDKD